MIYIHVVYAFGLTCDGDAGGTKMQELTWSLHDDIDSTKRPFTTMN